MLNKAVIISLSKSGMLTRFAMAKISPQNLIYPNSTLTWNFFLPSFHLLWKHYLICIWFSIYKVSHSVILEFTKSFMLAKLISKASIPCHSSLYTKPITHSYILRNPDISPKKFSKTHQIEKKKKKYVQVCSQVHILGKTLKTKKNLKTE